MRNTIIIGIMGFISNAVFASTSTIVPITLTQNFTACTLSVSPFSHQGIDISDNYANFNNPFAFYTNPQYPGVTLPGPQRAAHCNWVQTKTNTTKPFLWNAQNEQCILNGAYGYFNGNQCSTGGTIPQDLSDWVNAAKAGKTVAINLSTPDGTSKQVQVMLAYGHGVLNSHCGDVTLVKQGNNYVAVLQVGARAWSYEISQPANTHLDPSNVGGTCLIPQVSALNHDQASSILEAAVAQK